MSETLDVTQFLPRDISIINRYRADKGDLEGRVEGEGKQQRITAAWSPDVTIMGWMLTRGFLDPHHEVYAMAFMEMRHAWLSKIGYKSNSIFMALRDVMGSIENHSVSEMYDNVRREMGGDVEKILIQAITLPANSNEAMCNAMCGELYHKKFGQLVDAIDGIRKSLCSPA